MMVKNKGNYGMIKIISPGITVYHLLPDFICTCCLIVNQSLYDMPPYADPITKIGMNSKITTRAILYAKNNDFSLVDHISRHALFPF